MEYSQAFEDSEWAKSKVCSEDWEPSIEEDTGPVELRQDEDDDLENDQKTVHHGPENASGLVGDCAATGKEYRSVIIDMINDSGVLDIVHFTVNNRAIRTVSRKVIAGPSGHEMINCLDIVGEHDDYKSL